ncbi:IS21 family transposase [Shewanella sp. FDAARGOS_354]|uniref:IS21 family transposase n=1 Tax=Shewanella sp. FDAARGOS_354 TaxID=1930557 RepID=UPI000B518CA5|nr:IS21 family transposase [Shewanella sp. FDAARGOS_354]ASF16963.1 IS21 family transposase [Shewanella sp. FDAARGOS_354]
MSARPITVRKLKEILRLKYQARLSHRQIALSLHVSPSTVSYYANRAAHLGIHDWPLSDIWDDVTLERAFLNTQTVHKKQYKPLPNWAMLHQELKRPDQKGMTLERLWQEYAERNGQTHYSYNHFCRLYKEWASVLQPSMRQTHIAGEKLFVDYCGQTVPIIDPHTGELLYKAQIFVAVLGASNYTFAEATRSQQLEDWVMSHKRAFEFFGGVPQLVVPDCLKSAVSVARNTDPDLNPTYQMLAAHFGTAIMPARPRKPKDKSKAEVGVQIVTRWILAVLRHEVFHSLAQLNQRIGELLTRLNQKPFQKLPGSRASLFTELDAPALKPLPSYRYQYTKVQQVLVGKDYHVDIEKHYYSVPYALQGKRLTVQITEHTLVFYHHGKVVAEHVRSQCKGQHTSLSEHMPAHHQALLEWSPERLHHWAASIGPYTAHWVHEFIRQAEHPAQAVRPCLALLGQSKTYGKDRLEAACLRGQLTGANRLHNIRAMLKNGLEQQPIYTNKHDPLQAISHDNVHGESYFH